MRLWLGACVVLLIFAATRWIGIASVPVSWDAPGGGFARVLNSSQALFLAQVLLLGLLLGPELPMPLAWRGAAFVLLPSLLMLQQRSVWVVLLVCAVLSGVVLGNRRRVATLAAITVCAAFVTVIGIALLDSGDVVASLGSSVDEAFRSDNSTLIWRVEGWQALLSESYLQSPFDYLMGQPFGAGYIRYVRGVLVDVSPHNFYIQTLARFGVLGLGLLVWLYANTIHQLLSAPVVRRRETLRVIALLMMSQLVFFVPYAPDYLQGIILGWGVASVARLRTNVLPEVSRVRRGQARLALSDRRGNGLAVPANGHLRTG
jgi:O-antigen ligase